MAQNSHAKFSPTGSAQEKTALALPAVVDLLLAFLTHFPTLQSPPDQRMTIGTQAV